MKTDRELLELAATAMGFPNWSYAGGSSGICVELGACRGAITSYWNPLTDDVDAFILAVKLGLLMRRVVKEIPRGEYDKDPYAATRRAIVRAAAAIGETP